MTLKACEGCYGWCCYGTASSGFVPTTVTDITRIARDLEMPEEQFKERFIRRVRRDGRKGFYFGAKPCPFHTQGLCGIYDVRPSHCKNFIPLKFPGVRCRDYCKARAFSSYK